MSSYFDHLLQIYHRNAPVSRKTPSSMKYKEKTRESSPNLRAGVRAQREVSQRGRKIRLVTTTAVTERVKQIRSSTVITTLHSRWLSNDSPGGASVDLSPPGDCFKQILLPAGEVELQRGESRTQLRNTLEKTSMKTYESAETTYSGILNLLHIG